MPPLDTILESLNADGCHVESVWPDGFYMPWRVLARVELVAPVKDGVAFVSLWDVGYHEDPIGVHTHKIVRWSSDDPAMEVELIDDRGRLWRIAALVEAQDVDEVRLLREWRDYAAANAERIAVIDAAARRIQRGMMETWPE